MKAVLCTHFCKPEELEFADIPSPKAGSGETLVRVKAAALNFFDTLIIAGKYQQKPPFPFSPAAEFAGIVEQTRRWRNRHCSRRPRHGMDGLGRSARICRSRARQLVKIPQSLDFERAAGLCVTYGTSLYALRERAQLKHGETLAVLGASGGVGLAAVELGKLMGARVIACASSDEKLKFAREHGADETVNYDSENLRDALRRLGGEHGIDVIYDPVGGSYTEPAVRSLAWEGRYLVVGFTAGEIPKMPLNLVLLRGCDICGVFWGSWGKREPQALRNRYPTSRSGALTANSALHLHAIYPLAGDRGGHESNRRPQGDGKDRPAGLSYAV